MNNKEIAIVWFRRDLRLKNNSALSYATSNYKKVLPVYIHCHQETKEGEASMWWLHQSLELLKSQLQELGSDLYLTQAENSQEALNHLIKKHSAAAVFWNRLYEPELTKRDAQIKSSLKDKGIEAKSFPGYLLLEPWENLKDNNQPYKVFTPFYKKLRSFYSPKVEDSIKELKPTPNISNTKLEDLKLLPKIKWHSSFPYKPGEDSAWGLIKEFKKNISNYKEQRDFPALDATSFLSAHLHFGEISPSKIWEELDNTAGSEPFLRQLVWRDFASSLLFHFPQMPQKPLRENFNNFPWAKNYKKNLKAWQLGKTGYPFVDAGMRELWQTGIMHNRVRMVVASFLVKHLLIPWQEGEAWFWDTLVDADLANNSMGWQWVCGCGVDAAPYFRIFNPITQGMKFDQEAIYIKKWVPELKNLPNKYVHAPWETPDEVLKQAKITLGKTYPTPIVDHQESRDRALDCYEEIKG